MFNQVFDPLFPYTDSFFIWCFHRFYIMLCVMFGMCNLCWLRRGFNTRSGVMYYLNIESVVKSFQFTSFNNISTPQPLSPLHRLCLSSNCVYIMTTRHVIIGCSFSSKVMAVQYIAYIVLVFVSKSFLGLNDDKKVACDIVLIRSWK